MSAPVTGREEPAMVEKPGSCHCEPGCTDACCRPPVERDAAWHAAARKARLLSWLSLGYMAAEGAVAIIAAVLAGSVALLGFGLDSVIEGLASVIIVWRFSGTRTLSEDSEAKAQKAVAVTFFLLAPYVAYDAISTLAAAEHPSTSWLGIVLSVSSLIVMPLLGRAKRRLGKVLDSGATTGEGTQNLLCAYLAAAVLVGLLANTLFGLWWLDPVIGLLVAGLAVREGIGAWRGEECGC
ncbi:cation transporter [Kitasatospora sp. NPDC093102]|uniref:cation transporter n=1 Tax=Kitasatospora sp. NPDC093102 TaxID=3155069 RepID=UPI00344376BD